MFKIINYTILPYVGLLLFSFQKSRFYVFYNGFFSFSLEDKHSFTYSEEKKIDIMNHKKQEPK